MNFSRPPDEDAASALSCGASELVADDADSWKVYLLECADSTYYCGVTKNIDRRLAQHNGLQAGGSKYTRARRPVKLAAFRTCLGKRQAYSLEYAVKAAPRGKKLDVLLSSELPDLTVQAEHNSERPLRVS